MPGYKPTDFITLLPNLTASSAECDHLRDQYHTVADELYGLKETMVDLDDGDELSAAVVKFGEKLASPSHFFC